MSKRPAEYAAPLRKRSEIEAFLTDHQDYRRTMSTCSPLAWNVKAYGVDLSFDHIVETYRAGGYYGEDDRYLDYPEFLDAARAKFAEVEEHLWDWGVEDASRGLSDGDTYRSLWNGREVDIEYTFAGRSGGWLLVYKHNGRDLTRIDRNEFPDYLASLDYADLRDLYQMVVQNDHDLRREAIVSEIEHHTAFNFFENACSDIPRPDKTQLPLPLD